jgi:hypothetical protein
VKFNTELSRAIDWLRFRLESQPESDDIDSLLLMLAACEACIPWYWQELGYADELDSEIIADMPY